VVSQLVPYKRIELAVEAFNRSGKPLVVIGKGSEGRRLERHARSNIRFLGTQPTDVVRRTMQRARALIFPGEEDFGIVMAETQACGTPVIAFGRGGATEIVTDGATGLLFSGQTADSLLESLKRFERHEFDPAALRASALRFSRGRFQCEFTECVSRALTAGKLRQTGLSDPHKINAVASTAYP
jgi:glycosyltransferase involved in cell wall biosynthesis